MDDDSIMPVEITLAEAKAMYTLVSALPDGSERCVLSGLLRKLEETLYGVLSLEEMADLSAERKEGA